MTETLDRKRIIIFLLFAFGIAWATGLVIYLTGGLLHSPKLGGNQTLALVLITTSYAWAPALAHLLTRLITREGWRGLFLWPRLKPGWPFWLAAWFVPGIAVIAGCVLFFALFPGYFDPTLTTLRRLLAGNPQAAKLNPWLLGPGINGLVGSIPLWLLALVLFFSRGALAPMASARPEGGVQA